MSARACYHLREGEPAEEGDPHEDSALNDLSTVLRGLTMVSEPEADDRVYQQPQTRQAIKQVQG